MEQHYKLFRIRELAEGDNTFINTLAQAFLEEVPADANTLQEAVENKNHQLAYQIAHKMKPTIDMFELGVLADLIQVQEWGKHKKVNVDVTSNLQIVLTAIENATNEIRLDFKL